MISVARWGMLLNLMGYLSTTSYPPISATCHKSLLLGEGTLRVKCPRKQVSLARSAGVDTVFFKGGRVAGILWLQNQWAMSQKCGNLRIGTRLKTLMQEILAMSQSRITMG